MKFLATLAAVAAIVFLGLTGIAVGFILTLSFISWDTQFLYLLTAPGFHLVLRIALVVALSTAVVAGASMKAGS